MASKETIMDIPVKNLLLDLSNIRTGAQENQADAYKALIEEQGIDLCNLAEHIAEHGLSLAERVMVTPEKGEYVVLDGNRRIAAIHLVLAPELAKDTPLFNKFVALKGLASKMPKSLECVVFKKREDAFEWIKLRHFPGLDGVGQMPWGSIAQARARRMMGENVLALDALEFVLAGDALTDEVRMIASHPKHFEFSNFTRLIDSKKAREILGLSVKNGRLESTTNKDWLMKILARFVTIVATKEVQSDGKKFTVGHIDNAALQEAFAKKLSDEVGRRPRGVARAYKLNETTGEGVGAPPLGPKGKVLSVVPRTPKRPPASRDRKYIIPRDFDVGTITNAKISDIFGELCSLEVHRFPNAASVLLRTFVEISIVRYANKHGISFTRHQALSEKASKTVTHLVDAGHLEADAAKAVRAVLNRSPLNLIEELHNYVHSMHFHAKPADLNDAWSNIQVIIPLLLKK